MDLADADRAFGDILELAERHQLTTYDASYLELARRLDLPIATDDRNLIQAADGSKISILQA